MMLMTTIYLVLFLTIELNCCHHHYHPNHQFHLMVDLMMLTELLVDVEMKMDYDDEMKNIEMSNIDLMEDDQDLLKTIDNLFCS